MCDSKQISRLLILFSNRQINWLVAALFWSIPETSDQHFALILLFSGILLWPSTAKNTTARSQLHAALIHCDIWYTQLPQIVKTSRTTIFVSVLSQKGKSGARGPPLGYTSPHTVNCLIFPLDTTKTHRLNSIAHTCYWQRLFTRRAANYLSHSLLASILIREN